MKKLLTISLISMLLYGCAAYKELKPKPEINPVENGYIEILKDAKQFQLKKDKKYFIVFPPSMQPNFYLILKIKNRDQLNYYLTEVFDQGKGRVIEIPDESPEPGVENVYPISNDVPRYYFVIDLVKSDVLLEMEYRYTARWRYTFEREYASFSRTLAQNSISHEFYEKLGVSVKADEVDWQKEADQVSQKLKALTELSSRLKKIEEIFPPNILNTTDESYQNYLTLKETLEAEVAFQKKYQQLAHLLNEERQTRGDMEAFFGVIPAFIDFFEQKENFSKNVWMAVRDVLKKRIDQVVPYYEQRLAQKNDAKAIKSAIPQLQSLIPLAGLTFDEKFKQLAAFIEGYNQTVDQIWTAKKKFQTIVNQAEKKKTMPDNMFFSEIVTRLSKLQYTLPRVNHPALRPYAHYQCVKLLQKELQKLAAQIKIKLDKYRRADSIVPKINVMRDQNNIRGVLGLLKKNPDLDFLYPMYRELDERSLKSQANSIRKALSLGDFTAAELTLKSLYNDKNFVDYQSILPKKKKVLANLQDSLITAIVTQSRQRALKFIEENVTTLQGIDDLYNNPAFYPVHEPTFYAYQKAQNQQKIKALHAELNRLKTVVFPEMAIKKIYAQFIADPDQNGVLKARAIVAHGKYYKGTDSSIKNRIAECDPNIPKLLNKPKDYRRIFALPVTSNSAGVNEFLFKVNLRIPSPAQYPIFDVYIKLPKELAQTAANAQWYKSIRFNGKELKNEDRFTIVAPGPENNYECQVGPLQIIKTSNNILEVRFTKKAFKVYQISVMAQKPIIKKH
ncbi:hypothetical protein [Caldithrix abyssi]